MDENPTVEEIVRDWLIEHGFDGLFDGKGCGCHVDDLMPCREPGSVICRAGYLQEVSDPEWEGYTPIGPEMSKFGD